MAKSNQLLALLQSAAKGDNDHFWQIASQIAAHESSLNHHALASEIRSQISKAKGQSSGGLRPSTQLKGKMSEVLAVKHPDTKIQDLVLPMAIADRLNRIITEQKKKADLQAHGLIPSRKILLIGPPGTGKTMTAAAIAGELGLPLLSVAYSGLIDSHLGETAKRLKEIFDQTSVTPGVYFFDEFDAIGTERSTPHDTGETRRILNSFLIMLEADTSESLIIAATNHPQLLDNALYRRFDETIQYQLPTSAKCFLRMKLNRLEALEAKYEDWTGILDAAHGLSYAELAQAVNNVSKQAVLAGHTRISEKMLIGALLERRSYLQQPVVM
jgi:SpoVK/Ycf46/Vps4 family AAA+-type ATPase